MSFFDEYGWTGEKSDIPLAKGTPDRLIDYNPDHHPSGAHHWIVGTGDRVIVVAEVCGLGVLVAKMLPDPEQPDTMRIGGLSLFTREQIAFNEIDS